MKPSLHSVHPDLAAPVANLRVLLKQLYPGEDFAFSLYVEGILVASAGDKEDTEPTVWESDQVAAEVKKRVDAKAKADAGKKAMEDVNKKNEEPQDYKKNEEPQDYKKNEEPQD